MFKAGQRNKQSRLSSENPTCLCCSHIDRTTFVSAIKRQGEMRDLCNLTVLKQPAGKKAMIKFISLRQTLHFVSNPILAVSAGASENTAPCAASSQPATINHLCCFIWRLRAGKNIIKPDLHVLHFMFYVFHQRETHSLSLFSYTG